LKTIFIGLGDIAQKHIEVLKNIDCKVAGVLTRNYEKTLEKANQFGIEKVYKSIDEISPNDCDFFTILTSPENNGTILKNILQFKKAILVEKPVTFSSKDIDDIIESNTKYQVPIMVCMNRRFYSVFHKGLEYLEKKDKKIDSIIIEAPEKIEQIKNSPKFSKLVIENWMFCNSIHCIDLIRFFGGDVEKIEINSNSSKNVYSAIGHCEKDTEFTYISNWHSPGSWSVTLHADDIRITFNPLEKGIILKNHIKEDISPSPEDIKFKPGFYEQLQHFVKNVINNKNSWPSSNLEDHKKSIKLVEEIYQV